jgi:hypothetical protein
MDWFFIAIYVMIGIGFNAANTESLQWRWWHSFLFITFWPMAIAYAIGKIKMRM